MELKIVKMMINRQSWQVCWWELVVGRNIFFSHFVLFALLCLGLNKRSEISAHKYLWNFEYKCVDTLDWNSTTLTHSWSMQHWFISTGCNEYEYDDDFKPRASEICFNAYVFRSINLKNYYNRSRRSLVSSVSAH